MVKKLKHINDRKKNNKRYVYKLTEINIHKTIINRQIVVVRICSVGLS